MGVTYVRRRDYSSAHSGSESVEKIGVDIAFAKHAYKKLSSLTDNKTITIPIESTTQFEEFLLDMEELAIALENGDTSNIKQSLIDFNEYLGRLGVDEDYPFDGYFEQDDWFTKGDFEGTRNVVDDVNNVVYFDGTNTYNLVHAITV